MRWVTTPGKSDGSYSAGNIFQVFVPKSSAPVFVYNVTPHSEYLSTWMTDADPIFTSYLNDVGGQGIDPSTVKVKIDGRDVATYFGSFGDGETQTSPPGPGAPVSRTCRLRTLKGRCGSWITGTPRSSATG